MNKIVLAILSVFASFSASAADKLSEPFSFSIVGRVCEMNQCQLVNTSDTVQVQLKEDSKTPGNYAGEIKLVYSLGTVSFESKIQLSQFAFGSNYQTNFYIMTSESDSAVDHGSAEVIVNSMKELNSIAQYSTPFINGNKRIEITLVVGPTPEAVLAKSKSLTKSL